MLIEMDCERCGKEIPEGRLKAIPNTVHCIDCSNTEKVRGFRLITGKTTYTELQIVSPEEYEVLKHKQERRGMSPGTGVRLNKR